ncbi:MAG: hypothetical protein U0163_03030 [Gemmatimonadaceae bacterium]
MPLDASARRAILRAGTWTAIADGLFSSALSTFAYGSTVTRLFQGVAATVLGDAALQGGTRTALLGVAMHIGVAFTWATVFVLGLSHRAPVRRAMRTIRGTAVVAALMGPTVWLVMSLAVIPLLLHRAPSLTVRWLVQLVGHAPFVGLPIVLGARSNLPASTSAQAEPVRGVA